MIRKLYARFDGDLNVVCLCNKDNRKCDPDNIPSDCKEYVTKFTDVANISKRKISSSPRQFGVKQRKLSDELSCDLCEEDKINKIKNLIKR